MFSRRHAVSFVGLLACLFVAAAPLAAQHPKPKPPAPPPPGVTPDCVTGCIPPYGVSVTPDNANGGSKPHHTGGYSASFTVRNTGTEYDEYNLSCENTGPITCTGLSESYIALGGGASTGITVFYDVGNAGTGRIYLTAAGVFGDLAVDNGYFNITVTGTPGAPIVALRNQNGDNVDRSLCLTSGAGEAAGWECGDLFVSHGLPAYATMGRDRSLTLFYNSAQAVPKPLVAVAVTEGGNVSTPDSVHTELLINGIVRATATYTAWGTTPVTRQIAMTYDASTDSTGIYPFTLLVRNKYASGTFDQTVTGNVIVVNRSQSQFGAGWSLVGVERLVLNQGQGRILWVGGDASAKIYDSVAVNTWRGAAGGLRDTLRYDPAMTTYTRTLRHGIQVVFDAAGRHIRTVNRVGQTSTFFWTTGANRLDSIAVPPAGVAGTVYRLVYDGNGKLDRITDPASRILDATVASNRLTSLIDPDTYSTGFGYDAAGRMTSRTTRRGFTTSFFYPRGLRVDSVKVPLKPSTGDTAKTVFTPWDERGLGAATGFSTAVDTATAYTKVDGPMTALADTATFRVDRWGAPVKSTNPVGAVTTVVRGDASVPALPTQVTSPDGRIVQMIWNARGNLVTQRDSTLHLPNGQPTAVTRWTYLSLNTQDSPDSVIDPEGVVTRYTYNQWGLDSTAIAPNGHLTRFEYRTGPSDPLKGLLATVVEVQVPTWDTISKSEWGPGPDQRTAFAFNALGNVVNDTSPAGRVRTFTRDGVQRVTHVYDAGGHHSELVYDVLNRTLQSIQHVEGVDSGFAAPLVTRQHYDIDVVDSIIDPRGVLRLFQYDAANRDTAQVDEFGKRTAKYYNRAGLVDSVRLRFDQGTSGFVTRNTYDAAGRVLKSAWPARPSVTADSVMYTYDIMGRVRSATQALRRFRRSYYPTGAVLADTQDAPGGTGATRLTYAYDRAGRRTWYRLGAAGDLGNSDSVWYRYDAPTGELRWVGVRWRRAFGPGTQPIRSDSVRFRWDGLGRRDTVVYSNGLVEKFAYDADGMLRLACGDHPGGPVNGIPDVYDFTSYHQTVDVDGMIQRTTNYNTGLAGCGMNSLMQDVQTNTYDSRHQLRTQNVAGKTTSYAYDASGNIVRLRSYSGQTVFEDKIHVVTAASNRLSQVYYASNPSVGTNYTYNWDGARDEELPFCPGCTPSATIGYRHYWYDGRGRMTGTTEIACIEDPQTGSCQGTSSYGSSNACKYDPAGRMYDPCENAAPPLGFDGENVVFTGTNDTDLYTWIFVHGPGLDDPVMAYRHTNDVTNDKYWYLVTDGQGRQFAVGDATGYDMSKDIQYYQNGGKFAGGTKNANSFGADRMHNPQMFKVSFFRNRFYDQQTGRWTQEDPIGVAGGVNLYAYVGNNPVAFMDPFGLKGCSWDHPEDCKLISVTLSLSKLGFEQRGQLGPLRAKVSATVGASGTLSLTGGGLRTSGSGGVTVEARASAGPASVRCGLTSHAGCSGSLKAKEDGNSLAIGTGTTPVAIGAQTTLGVVTVGAEVDLGGIAIVGTRAAYDFLKATFGPLLGRSKDSDSPPTTGSLVPHFP